MSASHKLHVKIGHVEFDAEGPEKTVNDQFGRFLEVLTAIGVPVADEIEKRNGKPTEVKVLPLSSEPISEADIKRVFEEREEVISLRFLPTGDTADLDALVMILYGYHAIKNQNEASAATLIDGANQSGLSLVRLDRVFGRSNFVQKGGQRKGSRYGLTNPGMARARELVQKMASA